MNQKNPGEAKNAHGLIEAVRRLAWIIEPYKLRLLGALTLMVVGLGLDLITPLLLKHLIDRTLSTSALYKLNSVVGIFVGIYVLKFLTDLTGGGLKVRFNESVVRDIRKQLYDHLQSLSLPFFSNNRTGYLTTRLFSDTSLLGGLLGDTLLGLVSNLLLLTGAVAITLYLNWQLTIVLLLVVPILGLLTRWFSGRIRTATVDMQEQASQLCGNIQENLSGIALIQSYTMESLASQRIGEDLTKLRRLNVRLVDLTIVNRTGTLLMTSLAGLSVLWFGSRELGRGALTMGDLMAFLAYAVSVYRPVQALLGINVAVQQAVTAARRIFHLMDTPPTVQESLGAIDLAGPLHGFVRYADVSFGYDEREVLSNVSFQVAAGSRVAIVGRSGAGKSTMLSLLPRFYDVKRGCIEIDGIDISQISLKSLRSQVGIVSQETFLFAGTVRENLVCCRPGVPESAIIRAIERAQLAEFVSSLPRGLDTNVGERGLRISGGERQRLSIARALLKDPPILILDEATSSVDSISENLIKEALHKLLAGRTCFIIAHRFATILDADQIIVVERGRIAGQGKHDDLYRSNVVYARLYNEQFTRGEDAARVPSEERFLMDDGELRRRVVVTTEQSGFKQVNISRLPG